MYEKINADEELPGTLLRWLRKNGDKQLKQSKNKEINMTKLEKNAAKIAHVDYLEKYFKQTEKTIKLHSSPIFAGVIKQGMNASRAVEGHQKMLDRNTGKKISNERVSNLFAHIDRNLRSVSEQEEMVEKYREKLDEEK